MQTRRDKVRSAIAMNLSLCDVVTYPLLQAQRDLIQYYSAGTLDSALQELQEEAGTATAAAASGGTPSGTPPPPASNQPSNLTLSCNANSGAPAAVPTFSPPAGHYDSPQQITISDTSAGAKIYFTTDGSVPTTSSTAYSSPIQVSKTETVQAIAAAAGSSNSPVGSAAYTIGAPAAETAETAAPPTFSPVAGAYTTTQQVEISDTAAGAKIYFTVDGSVPTTSSTHYSGPIEVTKTATVQAIAAAPGFSNSPVSSAAYTIRPPAAKVTVSPTFSPAAGAYATAQQVTISDATAGAKIYFTVDGSVPTTKSSVYSSAIQVSKTETVQASPITV